MANPWDEDEVVAPPSGGPRPSMTGSPWDSDPVVYDGKEYPADYGVGPVAGDGDLGGDGRIEINIVGGTPESEATMRAPLPAQVGDKAQSLFRADSDFADKSGIGGGVMPVAAVKDMFGGQKGVAEYLADKSGGRVVRTSDGGYGLILPDGSEYRVNDEGFDNSDAANVAGNIAAAFLPASWAGRVAQARNIGTIGRIGLQGAVAGGQDAAMHAAVSDGKVDVGRAAVSAAGGGLGELAGTGLSAAGSRLGELARTANGTNQRAAINMLARAGIERPQGNMLARLAPQMEQARLGADQRALLGNAEFGFQYTQGQRLTEPARRFNQLAQEEVLRQSPGGSGAFEGMQRNNLARLDEAVGSIGERLGGRPMARPGELVQGSAGRLQAQAAELRGAVNDAYDAVRNADTVAVSRESVSAVPARLRSVVQDFDINAATTPGAYRTLEQVRNATAQIMGSNNVRGVTMRALETQRRILNNAIGGAANPTDRAALTAMRREFDGWMDDAIDNSLISGDPATLAQLREARGLRAEFGRRFEGGRDSDRFIAGMLDGSRTPEELMNVALGASQVSKAGGARFITRLRTAANDDPEVMGGLRAAHFARLTRGANGETLAPGQILRNIRSTEYNNASVARALYTNDEWREIRRLASALEPMVARGDMARSSGTAERSLRMLFQMVGAATGGIPVLGPAANVVGRGVQSVRGEAAVNGALRPFNQANPIAPAGLSAATEEWTRD